MKRGLGPEIFLFSAGMFLLYGSFALADTEAEIASETQRALTKAEIERLNTECVLPIEGKAMSGFPDGIRATRVKLSVQRFVTLVILRSVEGSGGRQTDVRKYDDLPKGGIGRRDFCEMVSISEIPSREIAEISANFAIRLRPRLELEKDYPSAHADIMRRKLYTWTEPSSFAFIELADRSQSGDLVAEIANHPAFRPEGLYFTMGDGLYIQLHD